MSDAIRDAMFRQIDELSEYVELLPSGQLVSKIPGRSNEIGEQLWCVVGGHESGVKAVEHGEWKGFECSLHVTYDKKQVVEAVNRSGAQVKEAFAEEPWTEIQERMGVFILEHDAMHQGQLIRFGYALDLVFPQSWKDHWLLDD